MRELSYKQTGAKKAKRQNFFMFYVFSYIIVTMKLLINGALNRLQSVSYLSDLQFSHSDSSEALTFALTASFIPFPTSAG